MSTGTKPQTNSATASPPSRRRIRRIVIGVLALLVIGAVAGGLYLFFAGDAPAEVDIESAVAAIADDSPTSADQTDVDGTWTVDTSIGTFDFSEATGSFAGFRVEEELVLVGSTTAVGRSPEVSGSIEIDGTTLVAASLEVDLTAITTDDSRRDKAVQETLQTELHPTATFVLSEPVDFGVVPDRDEPLSATATGELTIHGVANQVTIPLDALRHDDAIVVTGSTGIVFSDYQIDTPTSFAVLSLDDHGILEFQLWFTQ